MAESMATVDPRTENSGEGKAMIRKMYKQDGGFVADTETKYVLPETPEVCIPIVAGHLLVLEDLQDELAQAKDFNEFFADVYCTSYIDSLTAINEASRLLTIGDFSEHVNADAGVSDELINIELKRINQGSDELIIEDAAIEAFLDATKTGLFQIDEAVFVSELNDEAMNICGKTMSAEIEEAKSARADYVNEVNFLSYLKSVK